MCRSMGPMTENGLPASLDAPAFYDRLAPDYDEMTGFGKRFARETPFFKLIVENHRIGTALDAGCGTGFHSLLLAQLGVRVTAVDASREMIARLDQHGKEMGLSIRGVHSEFTGIGRALSERYDAVFCMGNTLPHLAGDAELVNALSAFASRTLPGGILILQMLNYERILVTRERIQGAGEAHGVTYVRFYDFEAGGSRLLFNILRIERVEGNLKTNLMSVPLIPITSSRITKLLEKSGYRNVLKFGSIAMDRFDPAASKDLVIVATLP